MELRPWSQLERETKITIFGHPSLVCILHSTVKSVSQSVGDDRIQLQYRDYYYGTKWDEKYNSLWKDFGNDDVDSYSSQYIYAVNPNENKKKVMNERSRHSVVAFSWIVCRRGVSRLPILHFNIDKLFNLFILSIFNKTAVETAKCLRFVMGFSYDKTFCFGLCHWTLNHTWETFIIFFSPKIVRHHVSFALNSICIFRFSFIETGKLLDAPINNSF